MTDINKLEYTDLIHQDILWLETNNYECLERSHIKAVLKQSIDLNYPPPNLGNDFEVIGQYNKDQKD